LPDQTTEPLDQQAAAVIAKARRLMLLTLGVTFLALAVVLMVVGYRLMNADASAPIVSDTTLPLPAGAKVLSTAVSDGRIMVTVDINGAAEILSFDQKTLKPAGRIQLKPHQ
jgi:hypothetical protein